MNVLVQSSPERIDNSLKLLTSSSVQSGHSQQQNGYKRTTVQEADD